MASNESNPRPGAVGGPRLVSAAREDDLRARIAARDESALAELVQVMSPWLLGMAQGMLHDADEAEDVVLETFRVTWERIPPPGVEPRGLIPWVLQVARNRAIDRLRKRRRRGKLGERITGWAETRTAAVEPDEAASPGWHVHAAVHGALSELPEDQLQAVRLAYFEGQTHSEIAERLSIPIGTVKTRLRLGLGRLRASLASLKDWVV